MNSNEATFSDYIAVLRRRFSLIALIAGPLVAITLGVALGWIPLETLSYERAVAGLQSPLAKLAAFAVAVLILWHAAHRLRITAHDLGVYADGLVMLICYGVAALGSIAAFIALLGL